MDLFWDVGAGTPPHGSSIPPPPKTDASSSARMRELEDRLDRLSMICCAMWTIIQSATSVSDEKLAELVQDLDLADGVEDGRVRVEQVRPCTACQRPVHARHLHCIYCGADAPPGSPFDAVL